VCLPSGVSTFRDVAYRCRLPVTSRNTITAHHPPQPQTAAQLARQAPGQPPKSLRAARASQPAWQRSQSLVLRAAGSAQRSAAPVRSARRRQHGGAPKSSTQTLTLAATRSRAAGWHQSCARRQRQRLRPARSALRAQHTRGQQAQQAGAQRASAQGASARGHPPVHQPGPARCNAAPRHSKLAAGCGREPCRRLQQRRHAQGPPLQINQPAAPTRSTPAATPAYSARHAARALAPLSVISVGEPPR